jgi:hypothetical protein
MAVDRGLLCIGCQANAAIEEAVRAERKRLYELVRLLSRDAAAYYEIEGYPLKGVDLDRFWDWVADVIGAEIEKRGE